MNPEKLKAKKPTISTATMVGPTGAPVAIEIKIPRAVQVIDTIAEHIVTAKKVLNTRIAVNAGNITSAEIRSAPTRFIANTITTAITTAMIKLYAFASIPVAVEKSSSNVTENILW
jgi:hypothetical protein